MPAHLSPLGRALQGSVTRAGILIRRCGRGEGTAMAQLTTDQRSALTRAVLGHRKRLLEEASALLAAKKHAEAAARQREAADLAAGARALGILGSEPNPPVPPPA
jgi:hypothetical protein